MTAQLELMRTNCRLISQVIGQEVFSATLALGDRLHPSLYRARMVCLPVLLSVMRDQMDRKMRGLPPTRGPSINALAASLDMPFETVRRNVQRMASVGWVHLAAEGGVSLPTPMSADLTAWSMDLAARLRTAANLIEQAGATTQSSLSSHSCDYSYTLAALDLFLIMVGTSKDLNLRFGELLMVHLICTASTRHLGSSAHGLTRYATAETVPADQDRSYVPLSDIARKLGISRSTAYRIINNSDHARRFDRRGAGVRGSHEFLASPEYVNAMQTLAGRTATLFTRLERHRCDNGCRSLDHMFGRMRNRTPDQPIQWNAAA